MPLLTIIPNAPKKPRRPRWEALVSMPLTGLALVLGMLLALLSIVGGTAPDSEEAAPAVEQPAEPAAPEAPSVDDGASTHKVPSPLDLAVAPLGDQLYLLQPVQLVSFSAASEGPTNRFSEGPSSDPLLN